MLPVLFRIVIPPGWTWVAAVAVALLLLVTRAVGFRRQAAAAKRAAGWGEALWADKGVLVAVVAGLAAAWRTGLLDKEVTLPLHSYGLMLALAFIAAIWLAQKEAERQGQDAQALGDLAFWVVVSALVGSRVYFILVNWNDYFGSNAWVVTGVGRIPRILAVWEGGLVFYGGFIAAVLASWWFMRSRKIPFLPYADTSLPSVAFGQFLGRIGCFGAGCCWGRACGDLPWGARFPPESMAYQSMAARPDGWRFLDPSRLATLPIHPVQLYESLGELLIFGFLTLWLRPRKRFHGQVLAAWLMLYAILRGTTETFRGDVERGVYLGLGAGQWTSIVIFAAGVAVWVLGLRRTRAELSGTSAGG